MRQSQLFTKTRKEIPKDEVSRNAELLIRAGYIHKEIAGVYSYLPLGLRVLNKIVKIIRDEMNIIGGIEMYMTALQDKRPWEMSSRWSDESVDIWFKTKLKNDTELGLAFTHEEPLTNIMIEHIKSYRDLPIYVYQFQTKFRNEIRAKSGIIRSREFLMKDLYSFSLDTKTHDEFYDKVKQAYLSIFNKIGIGEHTYVTFASGGSFSKYSHEFQTITSAGEDTIFVNKNKKIAINKDVWNEEVLSDLGLEKSDFKEEKSVEVGNIFNLGTRFSEALNLSYKDENGNDKTPVMGSYGIGPGRVMGTVAEICSDKDGLIWPISISPFQVHIIAIFDKDDKVSKVASDIYHSLMEKGVEVLYDDRDMRPGEKLKDSDLIGIPIRIVVSEKTIEENIIEVKNRKTGEVQKMLKESFLKSFNAE